MHRSEKLQFQRLPPEAQRARRTHAGQTAVAEPF